jgi:hypothetical protein
MGRKRLARKYDEPFLVRDGMSIGARNTVFVDADLEDLLYRFALRGARQIERQTARNDELCCDHENDEQDQRDVYERRHIDADDGLIGPLPR